MHLVWDKVLYSRLVESNAVRKNLDSGIGAIAHTRYTELRADVVGASCGGITSECNLSEVPPLLCIVLDEGSRVKVGLRNGDVEDAGTRRDVDCNGLVDAYFGSY